VALVLAAVTAANARMQIEERDYNRAWQLYQAGDARSVPARQFPFHDCFERAAHEYNLPVTLLLAVARGESDFNPRAVSSKSCYGVMQIQWPGTARFLDIERLADLHDPCTNIRAGARYLRYLLDRYQGNLHLALAAYNYGPGRIGANPRPMDIPSGAQWYSGYIYHHLHRVLELSAPAAAGPMITSAAYAPEGKLPLIMFHSPYKARRFMEHISSRDAALRLDWFRNALGESFVVLLHADSGERTRGVRRLRELGFSVNEYTHF
jgi:hypothetical protein